MPPDLPPHPPETPPHAVRVVARGALAGAATEVLLSATLLLLWRALYEEAVPPVTAVLLFSLGAGLAAGLAWGAAESAAWRVARPWLGASVGLLVGVVLAPGAPIAGDYLLHLHGTANSMKALEASLASLRPLPSPWLLVSGALCLYAPLLLVRRLTSVSKLHTPARKRAPARPCLKTLRVFRQGLGASFTREAVVMSLGVLAWGVALEVAALAGAAVSFGPLNLSLLLVLLLGRALVFPLLLRAADGPCALVGRRARGEVPEPRRAEPTVAARTPDAAERTRARWHDDRASAHQVEGRAAETVAERALAFDLWPTPERALSLARARAVAMSRDPALAALEDAAALAGGRATSFDPADPTWEPLRGHVRFEALAAAQQAAGARRALGPGARLLLAIYVTTLALGAAAPAVFARTESAELTRLRLHAWCTGDGAAWRSLGQDLAEGDTLRSPGPSLRWTPGLLLRAGVSFPTPAPELALAAFLRAAEAGDPRGMVRAADALACYPDRQVQAALWCRRAAEAGDPEGMWRWSRMIRGGWFGLASDPDAGGEWLRRAAQAGCPEAQVDLARALARHGDVPAARAWYERAVMVGHGTAGDELSALDGSSDPASSGGQ